MLHSTPDTRLSGFAKLPPSALHALSSTAESMALIPNLGSARFDSNGELRLAERLKDFLEENAWIWHNLPMRFLTMHNAKGLEFPCVAIGGLGALGGRPGKPIEDDIRLAYVAVTRAMHEAFLTYSRASPLVERLVA